MSRSSRGRVDPVLAGLIGATVAVGGGLVAYGSSQSADARPAPAPLEQRDDAVTARALAVVQDLASAGEDGTPSAPAAARRAAQASLRGQAVDPFRGSAKKTEAAAGGSATDAPGTAGGTATGAVTPTGPTGDATSQGGGGTGGAGSGTGDAAGSAATPGAPGSGPVGGGGAGSAGGAGFGSAGGTGSGSAGGSGSGTDDGGRSGTTTTPDGGVSGSPADPGLGGASDGDTAAAASRRAAALQAEAARLRRLEAERLARAPARVTLRVATTSNKRVRERLPVGGLLPNRAAAVVRVLRVARSNRVVTLRLRDGARLSGPQSPGTRCVLQVEATGQCRLVHVLVGKAAVIQAADVEGSPGPVTALRVLSVWRGDTRVFGD